MTGIDLPTVISPEVKLKLNREDVENIYGIFKGWEKEAHEQSGEEVLQNVLSTLDTKLGRTPEQPVKV